MAEGYCALSLIDSSANCDVIEKTMLESLEGVHTGFVSVADKTGTYNGVEVKAGDHIGVIDDDIIVCSANDPVTALVELTKHIPPEKIPIAHHWLILHGRYVCQAREPHCTECGIADICIYFKNQQEKKK
jgi:endonuclease III